MNFGLVCSKEHKGHDVPDQVQPGQELPQRIYSLVSNVSNVSNCLTIDPGKHLLTKKHKKLEALHAIDSTRSDRPSLRKTCKTQILRQVAILRTFFHHQRIAEDRDLCVSSSASSLLAWNGATDRADAG